MSDLKLNASLNRVSSPKSSTAASVDAEPAVAPAGPQLSEKQKRAAGLADGLSTTVAAFSPAPLPAASNNAPTFRAGSVGTAAALQSVGAQASPYEDIKGYSGPPLLKSGAIEHLTTPLAAPDGTTAVKLEVPWYSQFEVHGDVTPGNAACNPMCKEMMRNAKSPVNVLDRSAASNFNVAKTRDKLGHIEPDTAVATSGRAYLDAQLDAGRAVMVGVTWPKPSPEKPRSTPPFDFKLDNDGNADHYVVITGRGVDGKGLYYSFNDPGSKSEAIGGDKRPENRFYVDKDTGMLFRPGKETGKMFTTQARYEVSQIRKNE